jgi:uncharacterized membrane protein YkvA (DUF1232 family)
MPAKPKVTEAVFIAFIENGTSRLTPKALHQLVAELPELREKFAEVQAPGFPHIHRQFSFLADVVEAFACDRERDVPYHAALEAAFALIYFSRDIDLIPDFLEEVGYTDDAAVAATVLHRHATVFARLAAARHLTWPELTPAK